MAVAQVVLSALLAAIFAVLGVAKVLRQPSLVARTGRLGFGVRAVQGIGALEVAGAAVAHLRAGDGGKDVVPLLWLALIAAATAVITIVSP